MKRSLWYYLFNYGFFSILLALVYLTSKHLLGNDFEYFFRWWMMLLLLGLSVYPLTRELFEKFHDNGFAVAKFIGLAFSGYLMWLLSSLKIMKFTEFNCLICVVLVYVVCMLVRVLKNKQNPQRFTGFSEEKFRAVIVTEIIFVTVFLFWTYARGFRPQVSNTESPMDYGFMAAILRTDYMPPHDMWMSQHNINYYYVGQYMASFLTKFSGVRLNEAYALSLMTIVAGTFSMVYSLGYNLMRQSLMKFRKKESVIPAFCGFLSACAVVFAANFHYPLKKFIIPFFERYNNIEPKSYWFPSSTRFIGYDPVVENDKTIHEFPAYSFVLGDLHAHVINLVFVLCVLSILFAFLLRRRDQKGEVSLLREGILDPVIVLLAFFIGLFHMTNFWDFPIYYVVCGAIILFSNLRRCRFTVQAIKLTAIHGLYVILLGKLFALPFTMSFDQISTRICFTEHCSAVYQLFILWGLPVLTVLAFLIYRIRETRKMKEVEKTKNWLFRLLDTLSESDLFVITIGLCAIGLVLIPEVIYVEDIYGGSFARANTMFKLTYQAFLMFAIAMGYIIIRFLICKGVFEKIYGIIAGGLLIWTCFYTVTAMNSWFGDITKPKDYKGLDAVAFMTDLNPDDAFVIQWLNKNAEDTDVVLEAHGPSYFSGDQIYERISAFTGLSTVLGWETHEWLWHSESSGAYPEVVKERKEDVEKIYTSTDRDELQKLINKYDISYIYLGRMEKEAYGVENIEVLKQMGEVVYESPQSDTKEYESLLIKIRTSD